MYRNEIELLYQVSTTNPLGPIELPTYGHLHKIDLNSREVEAPKDVVVKKDHNSTVFYFVVDRFFDYMDLSTTCCIITYTVNGQSYVYPVLNCDVYTLSSQHKMILPWILSKNVTQQEGVVEFSFKFFKMSGDTGGNAEIVYSLNTVPTYFTVVKGLNSRIETMTGDELSKEEPEQASILYDLIDTLKQETNKLKWVIY